MSDQDHLEITAKDPKEKVALYLPKYCVVPLAARENEILSDSSKIYLGELAVLSNKFDYLAYTDEQLADMKGVSVRTIKSWHADFEREGFIRRDTWREHYKNPKGNGLLVRSRRKLYVIENPSKKVAEVQKAAPRSEVQKVAPRSEVQKVARINKAIINIKSKERKAREAEEDRDSSNSMAAEARVSSACSTSPSRSRSLDGESQDKHQPSQSQAPIAEVSSENSSLADFKLPQRSQEVPSATKSQDDLKMPVQAKSDPSANLLKSWRALISEFGLSLPDSVLMQAAREKYDITGALYYLRGLSRVRQKASPIAVIKSAIKGKEDYNFYLPKVQKTDETDGSVFNRFC